MRLGCCLLCVFVLVVSSCAADPRDAYDARVAPESSVPEAASALAGEAADSVNNASEKIANDNERAPSTTIKKTATTEPREEFYIAPYRGTKVPSDLANSPRLALKVDNAPSALPQQGIQWADIVFEELVEGGLTRFLAIFHAHIPESVGPIRSARSSDVPLLVPFDGALFGSSGSNSAFQKLLETIGVQDAGAYRAPGYYFRRLDRPAPSDLWAKSKKLLGAASSHSYPAQPLWEFDVSDTLPLQGSNQVQGVEVNWGSSDVSFLWDDEVSAWRRFQNGEPHLALDENGEEIPIAPENLIIQFTKYSLTEEVDVNGARIPLAEVAEGSGAAWVLRNGQLLEARWTKPNITVHTQFVDGTGKSISMAPGSTWILLAPRDSAQIIQKQD